MAKKEFRYNTGRNWFKGNTHIHSVASDGGKNFRDIAELYASKGYDFLFRTDHSVASQAENDKEEYPLLWLDGIEIAGEDLTGAGFHVVCLGSFEGSFGDDFVADMKSVQSQGGFTILAHPHWMGNSFDDYNRWRFDGIELYNHICHWLNGKSSGLVHWSEALKTNPNVLGFAADDAHLSGAHPGWNGGWICVNTAGCNRDDIMGAVRAGNFYSSCGPEIYSLSIDGDVLHMKTSPVQFVKISGMASQGRPTGDFSGKLITEFSAKIPADWPFVYIEIEDSKGRRAWTNNLFVTSS